MYKNILIATDGSDLATNAAKQAIGLAKGLAAKVTAVSVTAPFQWFALNMPPGLEASYRDGMKEAATKALGAVAEAAKAAGVACETLHVEDGSPYKAIIDTAKKKSCDLIVMASHGRSGAAKIVVGSETTKVLTHSKIPLLVLH
jgi:nucleotide-binding universal stress UspA family protein